MHSLSFNIKSSQDFYNKLVEEYEEFFKYQLKKTSMTF